MFVSSVEVNSAHIWVAKERERDTETHGRREADGHSLDRHTGTERGMLPLFQPGRDD